MHKVTYKQMVESLAKPGGHIIAELTPNKAHLWHMSSALLGEVAEVCAASKNDFENIIEECGDCLFYLQGIANGINLDIQDFIQSLATRNGWAVPVLHRHTKYLQILHIYSGNIFDTVKRHAIYGKALDVGKVVGDLEGAILALAGAVHRLGYKGHTLQSVQEANRVKLSIRYSDMKYSNEAAQTRADKPDGE